MKNRCKFEKLFICLFHLTNLTLSPIALIHDQGLSYSCFKPFMVYYALLGSTET